MSTPQSLELPPGITKSTLKTHRGTFATLDNGSAIGRHNAHTGALFVPGFMGSKEDFLTLLGPLADRHVRAIAIDLRGQFQSPVSSDTASLTLEGFAADVLSLLPMVGKQPHLVGHSFGGLVARESVLTDPLSVASLTLLDSGPSALPPEQRKRLQLFAHVLRTSGLEAVWAAKQALEESEGVVLPSSPEIREFLTKRFLANAPESLLAMVDILCGVEDRSHELAAVRPYTLVLFGSKDEAWSPEQQRKMGNNLDATIVELDGVGHSPAVEQPSLTADTLVSFWATATPG